MPKLRNEVTASGSAGGVNTIALSQSLAGAAAVLLNGALAGTYPVPSNANVVDPGGPLSSSQILVPSGGQPILNLAALLSPPQSVEIISAGNDSGITFTITGYDYGGSKITEVLAGANIGTATSVNQFAAVTSIRSSAATASTITVGTGSVILSPWLILGPQRNNHTVNLRAFLASGAATYNVEATSDPNLLNNTGGFADDLIELQTAQTASVTTALAQMYEAVRLRITSGLGTVILRALDSRTA